MLYLDGLIHGTLLALFVGNRSTVALMQNAVDLRSVFLDDVDPEARDSQQLPCRCWPTASDGSQYLVAEDAKRRHAASSGLGKTPSAQCLFYTGIWFF